MSLVHSGGGRCDVRSRRLGRMSKDDTDCSALLTVPGEEQAWCCSVFASQLPETVSRHIITTRQQVSLAYLHMLGDCIRPHARVSHTVDDSFILPGSDLRTEKATTMSTEMCY